MHSIARARDIIIGLTLLSVLIPLYNEEELVGALIERVLRVRLAEICGARDRVDEFALVHGHNLHAWRVFQQ